MKINSIDTVQKSFVPKISLKNLSAPFSHKKDSCDIFIRNNSPKSITFRGLPYSLNVKSYCYYSGEEAFSLFEKLKLGNYLDINGDTKNKIARQQRQENLYFLDRISNINEKETFLNLYENHTGFPDMDEVSKRIKSEFVSAGEKSQSVLQKKYPEFSSSYQVVAMGYDGVSSVAKGTAFPGSDLDKAYIILQGSDEDLSNEITVQNFKNELWKNTNQTILSYNHDVTAFPEIYTVKQINAMCDAINNAASKMNLFEQEIERKPIKIFGLFNSYVENRKPSKYSSYRELTDKFSEDYVTANKFIIDLSSNFTRNFTWDEPINVKKPSREDIYKSCFVIESILHGERLKGNDFKLPINKRVADLINLSQIQALKKTTALKEKYVKRKNIEQEYKYWATDKKFNFVKSMIKASCSDNTDFLEYYTTHEEDRFATVMQAMGLGYNR